MKILNILQHADSYVSVGELMETCGISKRTVYYDMDKINDWLKSSGLSPVVYLRSVGCLLPEDSKRQVPEQLRKMGFNQYYYTHKERKAWLAVHLITGSGPLFLQDVIVMHQVSRGTVHKELSLLKEEFASYRLTVEFDRQEGYLVEGNELDKRKAVMPYLLQVLPPVSWSSMNDAAPEYSSNMRLRSQFPFLQQDKLVPVHRLVSECERALGIELTDDMLYSLTLQLSLNCARLLENNRIAMDNEEIEVLKRLPEFDAARRIVRQLEQMFEIGFPDEEVCYIAINLLGAKVNRMNQISGASEVTDALISIIGGIVDRFQRMACVLFNNRKDLEQHLLAHLKPAYYRVKYGLETEDPAVEPVKKKYKELLEITRHSIKPLEEYTGKTWNDTQLAYIAMHFGGWLRQESTVSTRRQKAIIVCVNGMATSKMLLAEIEQLFPLIEIESVLSLRGYENFDGDADIVFTTVPLTKKIKHAKIFIVNPILTDSDKEKLLQQISFQAGYGRNSGIVGTLVDRIKQYAQVYNEAGLSEELNWILNTERQPKLPKTVHPSLDELLTDETVNAVEGDELADWREAIRAAAEPLIQLRAIRPNYVEAMIHAVETYGPYIIVSPGIAIAHAQPEDGANRVGMSLLRIEGGVMFSPEEAHRVYLLFVLSCADKEAHLKTLYELTLLLNDEQRRMEFIQASTKELILSSLASDRKRR